MYDWTTFKDVIGSAAADPDHVDTGRANPDRDCDVGAGSDAGANFNARPADSFANQWKRSRRTRRLVLGARRFGPWDLTGNDTWDVTTCFHRRPAVSAEHWGRHYWAKLVVIAALIAVQFAAFALATNDHSVVTATILAGQVAALVCSRPRSGTYAVARVGDILLVIWLVCFFTSLLNVKHLAFHHVPLGPLTALAITTSALYFASFVLELPKSRGNYEQLGGDAGAQVVDDDEHVVAGAASPEKTANIFSRLSFDGSTTQCAAG
ncbi:hypothetical protein GGF31_004275 [Allomyces arbusculus]|nr:hypothetical protein GGF31_004275 [Allomyces arbusculus]